MTNKKKRYRVKRMQNKEINDNSLMKHKAKNLMKKCPDILLAYPSYLYLFPSSARTISSVVEQQMRIQAAYDAYRRKVHELPC